jgi:hypothetical protein
MAIVLDLATLDMEDDEIDRRDEHNDFAEDFIKDMSKSTQKNVNVLLTFICPSQISIYCFFFVRLREIVRCHGGRRARRSCAQFRTDNRSQLELSHHGTRSCICM